MTASTTTFGAGNSNSADRHNDQMEPIGGGEFRLTDRSERLPHTYTLQARKL